MIGQVTNDSEIATQVNGLGIIPMSEGVDVTGCVNQQYAHKTFGRIYSVVV